MVVCREDGADATALLPRNTLTLPRPVTARDEYRLRVRRISQLSPHARSCCVAAAPFAAINLLNIGSMDATVTVEEVTLDFRSGVRAAHTEQRLRSRWCFLLRV